MSAYVRMVQRLSCIPYFQALFLNDPLLRGVLVRIADETKNDN